VAGASPVISTLLYPVKEVQQPLGACSSTPGPDPEESFEFPGSRRSLVLKLTFDEGSAATPTALVNVAA
jgi:hypothetical protein